MPLPFPMAGISNFLFLRVPTQPPEDHQMTDPSTSEQVGISDVSSSSCLLSPFLCLVSHSRLFPISAGVLRSPFMVHLCSDAVYPPAATLLRTVFSAPSSLLPLPQQTYTRAQLSPRLFTPFQVLS